MFNNFIYKFNKIKLKAISNPPKIIIIKLKPKIQFKFNKIELKTNVKNIKININSEVKIKLIKLFKLKFKKINVIINKDEKNFNQNNKFFIF